MGDTGQHPVTVEHLPERGRFRLLAGDREAVVLDYVRRPGVWDIVSTRAEPAFRGTGLASELVQHVFDRARESAVLIVATCPYIPVWISRHPDVADLVGGRT